MGWDVTYRFTKDIDVLARLQADEIRCIQLFPIPGRESFFARLGFAVQPEATVMDLMTPKGAG